METFPKDPFEMVKARIVSNDERQVMSVLGGARGSWGGGGQRTAVFG